MAGLFSSNRTAKRKRRFACFSKAPGPSKGVTPLRFSVKKSFQRALSSGAKPRGSRSIAKDGRFWEINNGNEGNSQKLWRKFIHVPLWFETEVPKGRIELRLSAFSRGASTERKAFRGDLKPFKKAQDAKRLLGFAAALLQGPAYFVRKGGLAQTCGQGGARQACSLCANALRPRDGRSYSLTYAPFFREAVRALKSFSKRCSP